MLKAAGLFTGLAAFCFTPGVSLKGFTMPETHFKISKKVIVTAFFVLVGCIASLVIYIYQQDKSQVLNSIKTNGDGIRSNTQVQQHLLQEVVRLKGIDNAHAINQRAHDSAPAKPDGG